MWRIAGRPEYVRAFSSVEETLQVSVPGLKGLCFCVAGGQDYPAFDRNPVYPSTPYNPLFFYPR